ncbi:MAG: helix-turn-helix domain-containing protein, partial [Thermoprotei archaeon]
LKRIGNLNVVTSRTPTHEELYSLLQSNISATKPITLLLSKREFTYIKAAKVLGYFDQKRKVKLADVGKIFDRSPSTVNRGIKNALNKVVNYLVATSPQQSTLNEQTNKR